MSIQLTIIKKATVSSFNETVAIGCVELDAALDWVDEIYAFAGALDRLDSGLADFTSSGLLRPAGRDLMRFEPTKGMLSHFEYQFTSDDEDALEQIINKITVVQGRLDLVSAN